MGHGVKHYVIVTLVRTADSYLRFRNLFVSHLICCREYLLVLCFISLIPSNTARD